MRRKVLKPLRSAALQPNRAGALSDGKGRITRKSLVSKQGCIKLIISIGIYESDASYIKLCSIVIYNQYSMLFKVVLGKEIRLFNCAETPSIQLIHAFINKVYPHVKKYSVYYLDEDNDQIVL